MSDSQGLKTSPRENMVDSTELTKNISSVDENATTPTSNLRISSSIQTKNKGSNDDYKDVPFSPLDENYRNSSDIFNDYPIDETPGSSGNNFAKKDKSESTDQTKTDHSATDSKNRYSQRSYKVNEAPLTESTNTGKTIKIFFPNQKNRLW